MLFYICVCMCIWLRASAATCSAVKDIEIHTRDTSFKDTEFRREEGFHLRRDHAYKVSTSLVCSANAHLPRKKTSQAEEDKGKKAIELNARKRGWKC